MAKTPSLTNLPFMDEVHKWTFSNRYPVGIKRKINSAAKHVLMIYRQKLRQAEKFVLDDETVKLICHLTNDSQQVQGYSVLARLPYSPMWIEFNQHAKVAALHELGRVPGPVDYDDISSIIGFLLFYDNHATRWIAHSFCQLPDKSVFPVMTTYVFDPDGGEFSTPTGSSFWRAPTLSQLPGHNLKIPVQLVQGGPTHDYIDPEFVISGDLAFDKDGHVHAPNWFTNRGAVIVDPYWEAWAPKSLTDKVITCEVIENAGAVRWLVTLLGALNALPQDVRPIVTRPGKRPVGMNQLPYFQHKKIIIQMPRENRVVWAQKHLQTTLTNMPRPWHRVLGHWRVIERGKSTHMCRHVPVMREDDIAICERCQLLVRWISDFHRGDPSIGIIDHTYELRTKRFKNPFNFSTPLMESSDAKSQTKPSTLVLTTSSDDI